MLKKFAVLLAGKIRRAEGDLGILSTIHWLCQRYHVIHPAFRYCSELGWEDEISCASWSLNDIY